ncbi:hypothetical protein [Paraburkholderia bryophila]|uniref:Uncharacterized protein n=1 Tax=Paraburkholderia bryophila TaxID=420952 RepID=A0A7Y9W3Q6_9BURK|nr:hypothetical protein [Paraburkholderia bryophila]NYH13185.1 hypothetical protein [Paraburkholderia bryophila]NYH24301.1 hypothetical protein [Paraburkholderia bryophila]
MDIIDMARASGMAVILDGRIGREEYQSVCGSISALQRFAEAIRHRAANQNDVISQRSSAANPSGRLPRRLIRLHTAHLTRTKRERLAHQKAVDKAIVGTSAAAAK